MLQYYAAAADTCERAHGRLAAKVPPPQLVGVAGRLAFRCVEQTPQQAIVLKCAAAISRLRASHVLLRAGFVQEQAAMHRLIDETNEDIWFLALGLIKGSPTPQHAQFLEAFYAEEFADAKDVVASRNSRNLVPRRKIRAFIARAGESKNPHRDAAVSESIGSMYSGFVHGAAQHILVCFGGEPPRFHLNGLLGTPLIEEHEEDGWNYAFRTLQAHQLAALTLQDEQLAHELGDAVQAFQRSTGRMVHRGAT
jgi:hypothetical protein